MSIATWRRVARHAAEFFRDYALLVAVFYPLDTYVQRRTLTITEAFITLSVVAVLWSIGVILDVLNHD